VFYRQLKPETAGDDGELCAEGWLRREGLDYMKVVDQAQGTMAKALRDYGGKRPDFLAMNPGDGGVLVLDAKHVTTANYQTFTLTETELWKYTGLLNFIKAQANVPSARMVFMVIPKESMLTRMVLVSLDDFLTARPTRLGGEAALSVRLKPDGLWADIDPADAYPHWAQQ
jgi:hypothetical protein